MAEDEEDDHVADGVCVAEGLKSGSVSVEREPYGTANIGFGFEVRDGGGLGGGRGQVHCSVNLVRESQ